MKHLQNNTVFHVKFKNIHAQYVNKSTHPYENTTSNSNCIFMLSEFRDGILKGSHYVLT